MNNYGPRLIRDVDSSAEFVCLRCTLPECNEHDPRCAYMRIKARTDQAIAARLRVAERAQAAQCAAAQ